MKFLGRLLLLVCSLWTLGTTLVSAETVINEVAQAITLDGQFTGGIVDGKIRGEWSDVDPLAFISPPTEGGTLFRVPVGDSRANSLLYAAIAPGVEEESLELYLMYDYLPRTSAVFMEGEFVADIFFPVTLDGNRTDITVQIRGGTPMVLLGIGATAASTSFFDVFVDINGDGQGPFPAIELGIEAAVGFGPSTLSPTNHLLIELEVPLLIPPNFGNRFPQEGLDGIYSPDPAFWGSNIANDGVDPPATGALFTILRDGSTIANSSLVAAAPAAIPEPSTLLLLASGLMGLGAYSWRRGKK